MSIVTIPDPVNMYQLALECDNAPLTAVGPYQDDEGRLLWDIDGPDEVADIIAAHFADPSITPPVASPAPTSEQRLAAVEDAVDVLILDSLGGGLNV